MPHAARRSPAGPLRGRTLQDIRLLVDALSRSARTVEQRTGVTQAQIFLLQQLRERGALSVGQLATLAQTRQSTASIVASRLVRHGLAVKARAERDARRVVLTLTRKGREVVNTAPEPPLAALIRALGHLGDGDLAALARGLGALNARLGLDTNRNALLFETPAARS